MAGRMNLPKYGTWEKSNIVNEMMALRT